MTNLKTKKIELVSHDWADCWLDVAEVEYQAEQETCSLDVYFVVELTDIEITGWLGRYSYDLPVMRDHLTFFEVNEFTSTVCGEKGMLWVTSVNATKSAISFIGTQGKLTISSKLMECEVLRSETDEVQKVKGCFLGETRKAKKKVSKNVPSIEHRK